MVIKTTWFLSQNYSSKASAYLLIYVFISWTYMVQKNAKFLCQCSIVLRMNQMGNMLLLLGKLKTAFSWNFILSCPISQLIYWFHLILFHSFVLILFAVSHLVSFPLAVFLPTPPQQVLFASLESRQRL